MVKTANIRAVPDYTAFPSKTNEYGRKTRWEIRRATNNGKSSHALNSDQPTRAGNIWAHETREKAERACAVINRDRAENMLRIAGVDRDTRHPPHYFETHANVFAKAGDLEAAAQCFELARAASIGHSRRQMYEDAAKYLRDLDLKRSRGEA
jgi:hypothetical protein